MILFLSSSLHLLKNQIYIHRVLPNFWENTSVLKLVRYDNLKPLSPEIQLHRIKIHTYEQELST